MKYLILFLVVWVNQSLAQKLETIIQKGHDQKVLTVAISPDGLFAATGSRDRSIKLWELSSGREVRNFLGHRGSINAIKFSPDGRLLLSSSADRTARLWNIATGKCLFISPVEEKYLTDVAFSPQQKYFITAGYNNTIKFFDLDTFEQDTSLKVNPEQGLGYGTNLAFSNDGKWLAVGEDDHTVNVYKTVDFEKVYTFKKELGWCGGCASWPRFTNNNQVLIMVSNNGPLKSYSLESGKLLKKYSQRIDDLVDMELSPDQEEIVVATEKALSFYNLKSGNRRDSVVVEAAEQINEITYTQDGKRILLACDNNVVLIWDIASNTVIARLTGILNQRDLGGINYNPNNYWESHIAKYIRFKNDLLLTNDGNTLIKGKFGTQIKQWDIASGRAVMEFFGHDKAAICYSLSEDGTKLISGGGEGKIIWWDVATGDTLRIINAHYQPVFDVEFSEGEERVLSTSWDGTMKVFDLNTGQLLHYFDLNNSSAYNALWGFKNLYIFTAQLNNTLKMREIDSKEVVREFIGHTGIISSMQLNNSKNALLSASWDGTVRLWDIATGLMVNKFTDHDGPVYTAVFDNTEDFIFSGGADRIVRRWDRYTGEIVQQFEGHQAEVTSILQSEDGRMLITHATDGVTKFWDLATGKEFFEHIHIGKTEWMAKTSEGYFTGTDGARKAVHFVKGLKTYALDQFFKEFYRPDLLPELFNNRNDKRSLGSLQKLLKTSRPPLVKLAAISKGENAEADVFLKVINKGSEVAGLRLFHNGKNVKLDISDFSFPQKEGESAVYEKKVKLIGGQNIISASAINIDGIESELVEMELFNENASRNAVCHILAVGINEYQNPSLSLNYARPDAEAFGKVLNNQSGSLFKEVKIHTLFDKQASREGILTKLTELAEVIYPEDVFIFYYAGHGSMVEDQFYFVPTEGSRLYDEKSLQRNAIEAAVLQERFSQIKALKQLIIMDACQSGGSVELLATRGGAEEKAIAQLSRSAGIHVMASTGSEQFATEFEQLGHGLFTYVLLEALSGSADGAPKDGKVTIYELKSYLDDQMPEMTKKLKGKPQYPYTFSRGHDFPIVFDQD